MNFVTHTLGEICDEVGGIIQTGPFGSQLHKSDYRDEGMPVIMPKDLIEGKVSVGSIARIGDEDVARLSRHQLKAGDIVYARRGDIGRRALITSREAGWICGTGCMRISLGDSVVHSIFLHYYLGQPDVVTWIYNQAVGATMPNLNTSIVRSIPITYPPLPTQLKIAAILSAYDDLIENNTRRIAILEEMAQTIYREWFVHFRLPGHEQVAMVNPDPELGLVPVGWEVASILDVPYFSFVRQNVRSYEGTKRYFATADVRGIEIVGEGIEYAYEDKPSRAQKNPVVNSVWFARMKETYKVLPFTAVNEHLAASSLLSSGFAGFEATDPNAFGFLFFTIDSDEFHERKDLYCTGATQMSLNNEGLGRIELIVPDKSTVTAFGRIAQPMVDQILILQARNSVLRRTRDLLLPRLISGEVDVSELPIDTGAGHNLTGLI